MLNGVGRVLLGARFHRSALHPSRRSGYFMCCTMGFKIEQFYGLLTQCIHVFVWISEQTAVVSLYSNN